MEVKVVPWNPAWPAMFAAESALLEKTLGREVIQAVHHIGSTAVEGLCAKPVIDLLLEVPSLDALDRKSGAMEAAGYEVMGEFGIPGRRYFRKGGDQRTHQIHAFASGSPHLVRHLAFRDHLRNFPCVAAKYGRLKTRLAAGCGNDLEVYNDGKDSFVRQHEAKALQRLKQGMPEPGRTCLGE